jgi:large subunit ribosomal protein L19e
MDLRKKKALAIRTFGVGEKRIKFVESRLDEIKEALTKQDMRDLYNDGAIIIGNIKGRKTKEKKKRNRGAGNVRKKVNKRKEKYVALTRKLRKHLKEMEGKVTKKEKEDLRKKIRNKFFSSKANFKEYIAGVKK